MRTITPTLTICTVASLGFAVALLRPAEESADVPPPTTAEGITIAGFAFDVPVRVAAGSTIAVVNTDSAPHTFTARDGSFDTGTLNATAGAFVAPAEPGAYDAFCVIHPSMEAVLVVG